MNTENNQVLPPHASASEKIAYIRQLARLDRPTVGRLRTDDPERAVARKNADPTKSLYRTSPVGRGYNIFGAFADNSAVQGAVLDFTKLERDGLVTQTDINDNEVFKVSGATMKQVSERLFATVSASGSGGLGAASFSGGMSSSFSHETMFRHEYSYAILYQLHRVARVQVLADPARLCKYLTPQAAEAINSPGVDAQLVIEFFGTHVLCDATYGARFEYSAATNKWAYESTTDASLAVQASFESLTGSGSGSVEVGSEEERKQYAQNTITNVQAAGGDSELAGSLETLEAWRASIDDNDPVLVQFSGSRPLLPIWELASDEERRRELREAVEAIASGIGAVVNNDRDLLISGKITCLNAKDEGGGNLELFGNIDVAILDGDGKVVWEANMLRHPRPEGYVVLKRTHVHDCGTHTARIPGSADPSRYTLRMSTVMRERDKGASRDDYLGSQTVERKFVEGRLLGEHSFKSRGKVLLYTFNVALAD